MGGSYQQEVDLQNLFKDVAREYVHHGDVAGGSCATSIDRAIRIARAERTVTCVIVPKDVQEQDVVAPPHEHGTVHTGVGFSRAARRAAETRSQARRRRAQRRQARWRCSSAPARCGAADEVIEVADMLGAGVAKALLGKAVAARRRCRA